MKQITATELRIILENKEKIIIVDVRESWEYNEQKLHPSSRNFPLGNLPQHLNEMSELKEVSFVVHCRTGVRSNQAQKYLMKNGFSKVINLVDGIEGYVG